MAYVGSTVPLVSSGAFLDTTTSLALGATATLTFTGAGEVCVMGGPVAAGMTATADLTIDSVTKGVATETDATPTRARVLCVSVGGAGAHGAAHRSDRCRIRARWPLRRPLRIRHGRLGGSLSPASHRASTKSRSLSLFR